MLLNEISFLFWKEVRLETRAHYTLSGLLLYLLSTIFVCQLSINVASSSVSSALWNTLFWIMILFIAIQTISKSFLQEHSNRLLYYHALANPRAIILAKIFYNASLLFALTLLAYVCFSFFLGNPVQDPFLFLVNIFLGSTGLSSTLTLIAAMATKAAQGNTLSAVLSVSIVIPLLIVLIKIAKNALEGLERDVSAQSVVILVTMNVILVLFSSMLFPYLWRS